MPGLARHTLGYAVALRADLAMEMRNITTPVIATAPPIRVRMSGVIPLRVHASTTAMGGTRYKKFAADAGLGMILARLPFARRAIGNHDLIMLPFVPVRSPLATLLVQPAYDQRPALRAVAERLITAAKTCG